MLGILRRVRTSTSAAGTSLAGLAVVAAIAIASCGSSAQGTPAEPAAVVTSTVDLPPSYKFVPESISVSAGTTVTWTNHDNFSHSVQFLDGGLPTEPMLMQPGATSTFTFSDAGTYRYQCHLHPQMRGTVTVTP